MTGSFELLLWVAGGFGIASGLIGFLVLVPASRRRSTPPELQAIPGGKTAGQADLTH